MRYQTIQLQRLKTRNFETTSDAFTANAYDSSEITAIAGSIAAGNTSGIGASVSINSIKNNTKSYAKNSSITSSDKVVFNARNTSSIDNYGVSIGLETGYFAGATSINVNAIENNTSAYVEGKKGAGIKANGGTIDILATDSSVISSFAGSLGGGKYGGVGQNVATNKIDNSTNVYAKDTRLESDSTVNVKATSNKDIHTIAAGAAAGKSISAAGSVVTNKDLSETSSQIISSAVIAGDDTTVKAYDGSSVYNYVGNFSGSLDGIGLGGTVVYTYSGVDTETLVENSTFSSDKDLNVYSEKKRDISTNSMNITASGTAALAANIAYTKIKDNTSSKLKDSDITSKNVSFNTKAYNKIDDKIGGATMGKVAGIGAVSENIIISDDNISFIDNTTIDSSARTESSVDAQTKIDSVNVSGSIAGGAGITGSVVNINTDTNSKSYIKDSDITSTNLAVQATDDFIIGDNEPVINGSVSVGAAAGIGGSLTLNKITNKTYAYIEDTNADVGQDILVSADSKYNIDSFIANAGVGGKAGVAGTVIVNTVKTDTQAYLKEDDGNTVADSENITVQANSKTDIKTRVATAAGGGVGIGASVDVTSIDNTVKATTGNGVTLTASDDIAVYARDEKILDSVVVGMAGGLVALGGGIGVYNIGSSHDDDQQEAIDGIDDEVSEQTDNISDIEDKLQNEDILPDSEYYSNIKSDEDSDISHDEIFAEKEPQSSLVSASIGDKSIVKANNIDIDSSNITEVDSKTGAIGAGGFGVGAGVGVLNNKNYSYAYIGSGSKIDVGENISLVSNNDMRDTKFESFAGAAGQVSSLGAAVSVVNNNDVSKSVYRFSCQNTDCKENKYKCKF